jgi:hypothetical protein
MIKYFNIIGQEKQELQKSYDSYIGKIFEGEQGAKAKAMTNDRQKELIKSLQLIFK